MWENKLSNRKIQMQVEMGNGPLESSKNNTKRRNYLYPNANTFEFPICSNVF